MASLSLQEVMHGISSQLSSLVEESEKSLVLGKYAESESISSNILSSLREVEVSKETSQVKDELIERAAIVFLQSCFETSNFTSARSRLCSLFGSLDLAPPNAVLLWISLALETDERRHADSLVLLLLKSKASRQSGWTREQYLTLVHMYTTEILLDTLKDPSEVQLWLRRQTFLPLDPRERFFLEKEIGAKRHEQDRVGNGDERSNELTRDFQQHVTHRIPTEGVLSPMQSMSRRTSHGSRPTLSGYGASPDKSLRASNSFEGGDRAPKDEFDLAISPVQLEYFGTRDQGWGKKHSPARLGAEDSSVPTGLDSLGMVQNFIFRLLGLKQLGRSTAEGGGEGEDENDGEEPKSLIFFSVVGILGLAASVYVRRRHLAKLKDKMLMCKV